MSARRCAHCGTLHPGAQCSPFAARRAVPLLPLLAPERGCTFVASSCRRSSPPTRPGPTMPIAIRFMTGIPKRFPSVRPCASDAALLVFPANTPTAARRKKVVHAVTCWYQQDLIHTYRGRYFGSPRQIKISFLLFLRPQRKVLIVSPGRPSSIPIHASSNPGGPLAEKWRQHRQRGRVAKTLGASSSRSSFSGSMRRHSRPRLSSSRAALPILAETFRSTICRAGALT